MIKADINLTKWINEVTSGSISIVELGSGFFNRLSDVNESVKTKIGIEIYEPYIQNAVYDECIKIHGDVLNYRELLKGQKIETVMLIDILEHFPKDVGFELIENLKKDFNKIILMLPFGKYEQNEDFTGYGGHEYQTHKSYWYNDDIEKLNFTENIIDENFHKKDKLRVSKNLDIGVYFGTWEKINNK
jgi:hypothetical protein